MMDERWADDENDNKVMTVTTGTETLQDGSTKKTVVSYKTNEKGQKIKVTKVIRYYKKKVKVNKNVEKRKKWAKFGDCKGLPPGTETGITFNGDECTIEPTIKISGENKKKGRSRKSFNCLQKLWQNGTLDFEMSILKINNSRRNHGSQRRKNRCKTSFKCLSSPWI